MGWFSTSSSKFNWNLITDENIFQDLVKLSFSEKVLVFKHSTKCSISTMSKNRLESIKKQLPKNTPKPNENF